jgi:hypothetical protein
MRTWTRVLVGAIGIALIPVPLTAQLIPPPHAITVIDSGTACSVAAACATWNMSQYPTVTVQITGTFTGTISFEATADGQTWFPVYLTNLSTATVATTTTTTGQFALTNVGLQQLRARATAAMTGGANLTLTRGVASSARSGVVSGTGLFADGTSGAPSIAFASEPTLGFFRSGTGATSYTGATLNMTSSTGAQIVANSGQVLTLRNGASQGIQIGNASLSFFTAVSFAAPTTGYLTISTSSVSNGVTLKVDALPTIASGFGTTPTVTAGSTPLAGSVNVGTGGVATSGVIAFNGVAFPSAPFCVATPSTTNAVTRVATSTTQLTFTTTTAWTASDTVSWICLSSK